METKTRNPGPVFGYHIMQWADQYLPSFLFQFFVQIGCCIAVFLLPKQRSESLHYLAKILKRNPSLKDSFIHFYIFSQDLILKLRVARGIVPTIRVKKNEEIFRSLVKENKQVLFGTFHVGHSDLMGFLLKDFDLQVSMIRLKVGNSKDTESLIERFGSHIDFIWVNQPEDILFQIKKSIDEGKSLAMKCDRSEFSSKVDHFDFLGEKRSFPVTIYKMASIFSLPIIFAFAVPNSHNGMDIFFSDVFSPTDYSRKDIDHAAHKHFQEVLNALEKQLGENPYLWFNFLPDQAS
jgi:predicted LPLAT superfamily acyltransferase